VTTIQVPQTEVMKRGIEQSKLHILEENSCMIMEGQLTGISQRDSQPRLYMTIGRVVS